MPWIITGTPRRSKPTALHRLTQNVPESLDQRQAAAQQCQAAAQQRQLAAAQRVQAPFDALPAAQAGALAQLDAAQAAARALALSRSRSVLSLAGDIADARSFEAQRAAATGTAATGQWAATATSAAQVWLGGVAATAQAHARAAGATATAIPPPAPNQVISRARGRVVSITGREEAGDLIVTIEIAPPYGAQQP